MTRRFRITYDIDIDDLAAGDDVRNVSQLIAEWLEMECSYTITSVRISDAVELTKKSDGALSHAGVARGGARRL